MIQEAGRDYKEPMFRVFLDAGDDLSDINMTLDIGTVPGGKDVIAGKDLGGFSTMLNDVGLNIRKLEASASHYNSNQEKNLIKISNANIKSNLVLNL